MSNGKPDRSRQNLNNGYWQRLIVSIFLVILVVPAWGGDKSKDEDTLKNATKVLNEMLSGDKVPVDVLARAVCIIVMPNVKKFGIGIGGSGGRGPMSCRGDRNFSGKWSAPSVYTIGGASVGLQIGGSSTDFVLVIMSQKGLDAMLQGKTKLGNEATAAAGPNGVTNAGTVGGADILTYARASGLFAGTSLGGATLEEDSSANQRLYDKAVTTKEIVIQNAVKQTPAGQAFVSLLNSRIAKHQS